MYQLEIAQFVTAHLPKNIGQTSIKVGDFMFGTSGFIIDVFDLIYYLISQGVRIAIKPDYIDQLNKDLGNLGKYPTSTFKLKHRDVQYIDNLFQYYNNINVVEHECLSFLKLEIIEETPNDSFGGVALSIINEEAYRGSVGGVDIAMIDDSIGGVALSVIKEPGALQARTPSFNDSAFYDFAFSMKCVTEVFDHVGKYIFVMNGYKAFKCHQWQNFQTLNNFYCLTQFSQLMCAPENWFVNKACVGGTTTVIMSENDVFQLFQNEAQEFFSHRSASHNLYSYIIDIWIHFQNPYDWEDFLIHNDCQFNPIRRVISFDYCGIKIPELTNYRI